MQRYTMSTREMNPVEDPKVTSNQYFLVRTGAEFLSLGIHSPAIRSCIDLMQGVATTHCIFSPHMRGSSSVTQWNLSVVPTGLAYSGS